MLTVGNTASNPCQAPGALPLLIRLGKREPQDLLQDSRMQFVLSMMLQQVGVCALEVRVPPTEGPESLSGNCVLINSEKLRGSH